MLCVVGMHGCGKSIFITTARQYRYPIVSMGDAVRDETRKRGLPPDCHGDVAEALRKENGLAAVATLVLDAMTPDCIVDGVRGLAEIDVFAQHHPVEILAIHASPKIRFDRVKKRERPGDPVSWKEFKKRDLRELAFGIGNVIALADYLLINESTLTQFKMQCTTFLDTWRKNP